MAWHLQGGCRLCAPMRHLSAHQTRPNRTKGLLGRRIVEQPRHIVATDVIGSFPPSKKRYCYVIDFVDLFTKQVELEILRRATSTTVREAFRRRVLLRWKKPRTLVTDQGTEFVNREIKNSAQRYGIHHETTPPYHPQANPTESYNRTVKTMIIAYV